MQERNALHGDLMDLVGAKVIFIINPEEDACYSNSIFADRIIIEIGGEQYRVEAFGDRINIYKR